MSNVSAAFMAAAAVINVRRSPLSPSTSAPRTAERVPHLHSRGGTPPPDFTLGTRASLGQCSVPGPPAAAARLTP
jgi:hypothetical protein